MDKVWKHCTAKPPAKYVLLYIADRARDDGTGAYPSNGTITRMTRLGIRTVVRSVSELEAAGYLVVIRDPGRHNRYLVRPTGAALALVEPVPNLHEPVPHSPATSAKSAQTSARAAHEPLEPPLEPLEPQVVAVYLELYGAPPTTAKWTYLASIEERWPADRAVLALRSEHAKDPDPRTICGRMVAGLKAGDLITRSGVA